MEDILELSESTNETVPEKEDSIEYFAENLPNHIPSEQVAPNAPVPPTIDEIPSVATLPTAEPADNSPQLL